MMHPDDETEVFAERAREAVTLTMRWPDPGDQTLPRFHLTIDGDVQERMAFMASDPDENAHAFFRSVSDGVRVARFVYTHMLKQQGLSQEDFDSVLVGMAPVPDQPEGGVPFGELFSFSAGEASGGDYVRAEGTIFAGSGEQWRVYEFPTANLSSDPEYNEATDADTDLAGDETTGG